MRYGIIADVHANQTALDAVIRDGASTDWKVQQWIFLGDAVGYGPNPVETLQMMGRMDFALRQVGNHDALLVDAWQARIDEAADFTIKAHRDILREQDPNLWQWCLQEWRNQDHMQAHSLNGKAENRWFVHGSFQMTKWDDQLSTYLFPGTDRNNADHKPRMFDILQEKKLGQATPAVLFHGHTHIPYGKGYRQGMDFPEYVPICYSPQHPVDLNDYDRLILCPGSVGQPRNPDPVMHAAYGILDTDMHTFQFRRVPYNVQGTLVRMAALGYPPILRHILRGYHPENPVWMDRRTQLQDFTEDDGVGALHGNLLEWNRIYRHLPDGNGWEPVDAED